MRRFKSMSSGVAATCARRRSPLFSPGLHDLIGQPPSRPASKPVMINKSISKTTIHLVCTIWLARYTMASRLGWSDLEKTSSQICRCRSEQDNGTLQLKQQEQHEGKAWTVGPGEHVHWRRAHSKTAAEVGAKWAAAHGSMTEPPAGACTERHMPNQMQAVHASGRHPGHNAPAN